MKATAYTLRALTNMHAGSGDTNYGIIDKEVQRDAITSFPVIHASSLKGAFRELFASKAPKGNEDDLVKAIFGDPNSDKTVSATHIGSHRFHEARLLALPVRSNFAPYFMATCPAILKELVADIELFNISAEQFEGDLKYLVKALEEREKELNEKIEESVDDEEKQILKKQKQSPIIYTHADLPQGEAYIDEFVITNIENASGKLRDWLGDDVAIFNDNDFADICKRLPVIARNQLNNGISNNLWYEEIVPRRSLFYFFIETDDTNKFDKALSGQHQNRVQVGGNATVGYGLSEVKPLT